MPAAAIWAVNALAVAEVISVGTAVAIGTFIATYGTAIMVVGGLAYAAEQARKAKAQARDTYNASQVDRLVNISSGVAPRELVLGRVRKAGTVFYKASTGQYNKDMYLAIALAGHEIDAIEQIYLNDQPVTLDVDGYVQEAPYHSTRKEVATDTADINGVVVLPASYITGSASAVTGSSHDTSGVSVSISGSGPYTLITTPFASVSYSYMADDYAVQITRYLGGPGQQANPSLRAAFPDAWGDGNVVQGVAYLVVKLTYSENAFPIGAPNVTAVVRGAKVYDPRTGLTEWSENPALLMRHVYQHSAFGKATVTAAEDVRFTAAANACDTVTNYSVGGVFQASRALYKAALVVPFGAPAKSPMDDLAQAMGGSWAFAGGELYLKAGVYTASVMSLTDDDLAVVQRDASGAQSQSPIRISVHRERNSRINTIKPTIWDVDQDYKQTALTALTSAALVARDGAELVQEVSMPAVGYAPQALHISGIIIRDGRDALTVELPFKMRAYPVELFDTVDLTIARYGWVNKTFMVIGRQWAGAGVIGLTLKETAAAIFQMDAGFPAQGYAANTNLPAPWLVADVTGVVCASGTNELIKAGDGTIISRLRVSWVPVPDAAVQQGGKVEVQIREVSSAGAWLTLTADGTESTLVTRDVVDGAVYNVRVRARTSLGVGQWSALQSHKVLGKTEPPGTPASIAATTAQVWWSSVTDLDLAGYRIRAFAGASGAAWSLSTDLHTDLISSGPWSFGTALFGVQTIMVAAVDTSGNVGLPASMVVDFGAANISAAAASYDFQAAGYPGSYSACTPGATLLADVDASSSLYALVDDYAQADLYAAGTWAAMQWISSAFVVNWGGGQLVLQTTTSGPATVEYRFDGSISNDEYSLVDAYSASDLYGSSDWALWPGALAVQRGLGVQWRISIGGGVQQGSVAQCVAALLMPDVRQQFSVVDVPASGVRLSPSVGSPTRSWVSIRTAQITPIYDGGTAVAGRVRDFSPSMGPFIELVDSSGSPVAGRATVDIGGYADV